MGTRCGTCARRLLEQRVPRLPGSWPGPAVPVSMGCCAAWGTALHGVLGDASAHVGRWTLFAPGGRLCTSLIGRFITSGSKNTVYAKKGKREEGSKKIIRAYWKRASKTSPTLMCNRPEERVPRSERFLCLAADGRRSARLCRRKLPLGQYSTRVSSWPSP